MQQQNISSTSENVPGDRSESAAQWREAPALVRELWIKAGYTVKTTNCHSNLPFNDTHIVNGMVCVGCQRTTFGNIFGQHDKQCPNYMEYQGKKLLTCRSLTTRIGVQIKFVYDAFLREGRDFLGELRSIDIKSVPATSSRVVELIGSSEYQSMDEAAKLKMAISKVKADDEAEHQRKIEAVQKMVSSVAVFQGDFAAERYQGFFKKELAFFEWLGTGEAPPNTHYPSVDMVEVRVKEHRSPNICTYKVNKWLLESYLIGQELNMKEIQEFHDYSVNCVPNNSLVVLARSDGRLVIGYATQLINDKQCIEDKHQMKVLMKITESPDDPNHQWKASHKTLYKEIIHRADDKSFETCKLVFNHVPKMTLVPHMWRISSSVLKSIMKFAKKDVAVSDSQDDDSDSNSESNAGTRSNADTRFNAGTRSKAGTRSNAGTRSSAGEIPEDEQMGCLNQYADYGFGSSFDDAPGDMSRGAAAAAPAVTETRGAGAGAAETTSVGAGAAAVDTEATLDLDEWNAQRSREIAKRSEQALALEAAAGGAAAGADDDRAHHIGEGAAATSLPGSHTINFRQLLIQYFGIDNATDLQHSSKELFQNPENTDEPDPCDISDKVMQMKQMQRDDPNGNDENGHLMYVLESSLRNMNVHLFKEEADQLINAYKDDIKVLQDNLQNALTTPCNDMKQAAEDFEKHLNDTFQDTETYQRDNAAECAFVQKCETDFKHWLTLKRMTLQVLIDMNKQAYTKKCKEEISMQRSRYFLLRDQRVNQLRTAIEDLFNAYMHRIQRTMAEQTAHNDRENAARAGKKRARGSGS